MEQPVTNKIKQVIIIDCSLGMSRGKMAAQACHASINAYIKAPENIRDAWNKSGGKKIVLKKGKEDFEDIAQQAERLNIPQYEVCDAGLTELEPGTVTALGLGPEKTSKIDKVTSEMKLLK